MEGGLLDWVLLEAAAVFCLFRPRELLYKLLRAVAAALTLHTGFGLPAFFRPRRLPGSTGVPSGHVAMPYGGCGGRPANLFKMRLP